MKIVAIGDIHGMDCWKRIVEKEVDADQFVFIGDYFDSFDIPLNEQLYNFLAIIDFKKNSPKKVVMLIGNHDHHYFPEVGDSNTGGYQKIGSISISKYINLNREHLQMAHQLGEILFTHAGVCNKWVKNNLKDWNIATMDSSINELFKYNPKYPFLFTGYNIYGNDIGQTPIWIRPESLMKSNRDTFRKDLIQVVGHTAQNTIDIEGKSTGGRYYFIDTLARKQYLIIEDGAFKIGII